MSNSLANTTEKIGEFWNPSIRKCYYWERKLILDSLKKLAVHGVPGNWLDIGCGRKPYQPLFLSQATAYFGVDYPVTMVNSYRDSTKADAFANCSTLPFKPNTFETVLCTQVLEHVPDPKRLIQEINRVLKPNGVLILTAPMTWPLHEEPFDFYRYTIYGLRSLLKETGFNILEEVSRGGALLTISQVFLDTEIGGHRNGGFFWRLYSSLLSVLMNSLGYLGDKALYQRRLALGISIAAKKL